MYYKEKLINGVWHYKTTPNMEWKPMSITQLEKKLALQEVELNKLRKSSRYLLEALQELISSAQYESVDFENRRVGSKGISSDESICKALEALKALEKTLK